MEDPSFKYFTSRRLVIRRFASGDAEGLASYRSDAEVARYQDWECPYPLDEAREFIASLRQLAPGTPGTWFQFAVSFAASGTLIGRAHGSRVHGRRTFSMRSSSPSGGPSC